MNLEFSRNLPVDDAWDVIVVGGGPAGCAAATAAAREGARTLLIEATGVLGGMGTSGRVPWFCGYADGERFIARGLAEHVRLALLAEMPCQQAAVARNPLAAPAIDVELLKRVYDEMLTEAGAEILFHTQLVAVAKEEGEIAALVIANKAGLSACRARIYVDCTGDADLAAGAGAAYEKGDEQGGLQAATHCFTLANVDEAKLAAGPDVHFYDPKSPVWSIIVDDEFPLLSDLHSCYRGYAPGTIGFNAGHIYGVDNTDPRSISHALITGRQMAAQYQAALAKYHPAFEHAYLAATGSLMGVRETRRILGDYVLSVDDYRAARHFPDEICRAAYNLDVHESKPLPRDLTPELIPKLKQRNQESIENLPAGKSLGVPYRCLVPRDLPDVLVAGRCISTDRRTNGCIRIMACCLTTGEAAGLAAAMAAAEDQDVHGVDAHELRGKLRTAGAYLPDEAETSP